jgi:hypothetical protein
MFLGRLPWTSAHLYSEHPCPNPTAPPRAHRIDHPLPFVVPAHQVTRKAQTKFTRAGWEYDQKGGQGANFLQDRLYG